MWESLSVCAAIVDHVILLHPFHSSSCQYHPPLVEVEDGEVELQEDDAEDHTQALALKFLLEAVNGA